MKLSQASSLFRWFHLLTYYFMLGCSLLSQKSDSPQMAGEGEKYKTTSVWSETLMPVPAEVAADIAQIRQGRSASVVGVKNTGQWQQQDTPVDDKNAALEDNQPLVVETEAGNNEKLNAEEKTELPAKNRKISSDGNLPIIDKSGKNESYKVKAGDTLMKIAFSKYGNVYRWKEILSANADLIQNFNKIRPGMVLQIYGVQYVAIEQDGEIYLIRKNDTLMKISRNLYGSPSYWINLWKKNQLLIRNPDQIYAGFNLYYDTPDKLKREK